MAHLFHNPEMPTERGIFVKGFFRPKFLIFFSIRP